MCDVTTHVANRGGEHNGTHEMGVAIKYECVGLDLGRCQTLAVGTHALAMQGLRHVPEEEDKTNIIKTDVDDARRI